MQCSYILFIFNCEWFGCIFMFEESFLNFVFAMKKTSISADILFNTSIVNHLNNESLLNHCYFNECCNVPSNLTSYIHSVKTFFRWYRNFRMKVYGTRTLFHNHFIDISKTLIATAYALLLLIYYFWDNLNMLLSSTDP